MAHAKAYPNGSENAENQSGEQRRPEGRAVVFVCLAVPVHRPRTRYNLG